MMKAVAKAAAYFCRKVILVLKAYYTSYNAKKEWTRVAKLRRKIRGIYIVVAIIVMNIFIVVNLHILSERKEQNQRERESKLPYEEYIKNYEDMMIRVVIKNNGFKQITHTVVQLSSAQGFVVSVGEEQQEYAPNEVLQVTPDDVRFQKGSIKIEAKNAKKITINSLNRGCGTPSYRGSMELFKTAEGIVVVNELPLEEYLCAVVPSEMPASYEIEALKCQAVCARSYAYCQMQELTYPEYNAHVDDSTAFQVYGNSLEQESTTQAVQTTAGKVLTYQEQVVKTYYYSTSCGKSASVEAWGTSVANGNKYLCGVSICNENGEDYEKSLPWYRWKAEVSEQTLSNLIELNTGTEIGNLKDVKITKQGQGGVALQIVATGTTGKVTVNTENKIRSALGGSGYKIEKQDGTVIDSTKLLPSAFFTITKSGQNYIIEGGGYGHGIGMSQNGANEMAKEGKTYEEILQFFYPGTKVK